MEPRSPWRTSRRATTAGALVILCLVLTACVPAPTVPPTFSQVGDFTLTERSGEPVSKRDLAGKYWVADFFFAGCAAECVVLGHRMGEIQRLVAPLTNVILVSFTVDPRSDTPASLRRYADRFDADPARWLFLTGDREVLYRTITESFLLPVAESPEERLQLKGGFVHSNKIAIVDPHGAVRAYFDGLHPATPQAVLRTIQNLMNDDPPQG